MTKADHFRVLAVAAALAGGLLALIAGAEPARAAFPGANGKMAFDSNRDGDNDIFAMNLDGTGQTKLKEHETRCLPGFLIRWEEDCLPE